MRGDGKTTRQMQALPKDALFVWYNGRLDYPRRLAKQIGRDDLAIVSPEFISGDRWRGLRFSGIAYDHACFDVMGPQDFDRMAATIAEIQKRVPVE